MCSGLQYGVGDGGKQMLNTLAALAFTLKINALNVFECFIVQDWEEFMTHLNDPDYREEGRLVKVLIVVLADELFESGPCLDEIHAGMANKAVLLPVRFKDVDIKTVARWRNQVQGNMKRRIQRNKVMEMLKSTNSIPPPGSVVADDDDVIEQLVGKVKGCITEDSPCTFPSLKLMEVCSSFF